MEPSAQSAHGFLVSVFSVGAEEMEATRIPKKDAHHRRIEPRYEEPWNGRPGGWDVAYHHYGRKPRFPKWMEKFGFTVSEDEARVWIFHRDVFGLGTPLQTEEQAKGIIVEGMKRGYMLDGSNLDGVIDILRKFQIYGHLHLGWWQLDKDAQKKIDDLVKGDSSKVSWYDTHTYRVVSVEMDAPIK